ncbi:MAG TPA: efflux RND transporter periplasmic adaptor subunit [Defluviitoga tunisiensis]|nr:efflux RND transporter periplasmic adaptor subunit [Defluviitoga tunisiensis]
MKKSNKVLLLIVLVIFLAVVFFLVQFKMKATDQSVQQQNYREYKVSKGTLINTISVSGTIKANKVLTITPKVSGVVKRIYVKKGDKVNKGDILFEIEEVDYKLSYLNALKTYENAKLSNSKVDIQIAELEFEKAKKNLENTKVLAPTAGTVLEVNINEGDNVNTSMSALKMVDDTKFYVSANVDESDYPNIVLGQHAIITLSSDENVTLHGEIAYISNQAETSGGVTSVPIEIAITTQNATSSNNNFFGNYNLSRRYFTQSNESTNTGLSNRTTNYSQNNPRISFSWQNNNSNGNLTRKKLIDGLSCDVEIITFVKSNVLIIPSNAITRENGKDYVLIKTEKEPEKREIKIGESANNGIEVLEGLNEGDIILISSKISSNFTNSSNQSRNQQDVFRFMMGQPPR